jgi:glutaminase
VLSLFERAAGRRLEVDEAVFLSERETGHRNRAIGHLLRAVEVFDVPVDEVLDLYFRQCSIRVTAIDLAVMGATLANLGMNPLTQEDVFHLDATRDTLSVMFTCGMYDGAGDWSINVGLPAKSGVGGGIMGVVNRQVGIGVFSPRLDENGNSVRGKLSCMGLAEQIGLHAFDPTNPGSTFLRRLTA